MSADPLPHESEATIALAESVSLAVLIEPALLRLARLRLTGSHDAGVEADVWFSSWVASRGPDGIVLHRDAAEWLRERLAASKPRLHASWELIRELHVDTSPALRLEEEIAWLLADGGGSAMPQIRERLRRAVATLVGGERTGLAHWASQAIDRLPRQVAALEEVRMLDAAARLRLGASLDEESLPDWMAWVAPSRAAVQRQVRLRMFPGILELEPLTGDAGGEPDSTIAVPGLQPLLLEVDAGDGPETVAVDEQGTTLVRVGEAPVRIRTSDRALYEVAPARTPERELRSQVIDFSELLRDYERRFVMPEPLALLKELTEKGGTAVVLTGNAGTGKTALLNQLVAERRAGAIFHFFSNRSRRWRDTRLAVAALAAQAELMLPRVQVKAAKPMERLRQLLDSADPSGRPLLLVLDGLDEADDRVNHPGVVSLLDALLSNGVPAGVALVCSCDALGAVRSSLPGILGSQAVEVDLGEPRWRTGFKHAVEQMTARSILPNYAELLNARFSHRFNAVAGSPVLSSRMGDGRQLVGLACRVPTERVEQLLQILRSTRQRIIVPRRAVRGMIVDPGRDVRTCRTLVEPDAFEALATEAAARGATDVIAEPIAGSVARAWEGLSLDQRQVLGVIAASQEPLTALRIASAARVPAEQIAEILQSLAPWLATGRTPDHEDTFVPMHERLREAILDEVDEGRGDHEASSPHVGLLADVARWDTRDRGDFQREYALRYGLEHAALAKDGEEIERLLRDLDFIEARSALDGPHAFIDILEDMPAADHPDRLPEIVKDALLAAEPWYAQDLAAVRFLAYALLRHRGPVTGAPPPLRPRRPPVRLSRDWEHRGAVTGCAEWQPGQLVTWADDGSIRRWTEDDGGWRAMWELNGSTSAITAAVAIPGEFVWASRDGTVQAAGETLNTRVVVRHGTPVLGIVTAVPGDVVSWDYRGFVRVTDLESGGVVHAMRAHDGPVTACAPGPGQLFTGSAEGAIRVWSGVIAVSVIDLSPDGDEAAGGAVRALRARLRDGIRQGRSEIEFPLRQPSRAAAVERIKALTGLDLRQRGGMRSSVRVKLDGEVHHFGVTVTAETGGERAVFATDKPEERAVTLEGHAAAVTSLVWSDYLRQLLSTSDDGTVRAWDPAEGREAAVLRGHESAVLGCLAMFQTASALTWSRDHTLRLWDVGAGKEVRRFSGHHGAVLGARLLPDARLLSWSADQTVRLWDVNTGATLAVLEGHAAAVNGALLLPDDRVVSWSDDRTIRFWTMDGALIDPDSASQSASTPAMPRIVKPRGIVGVSPAAILECVVHADSTTATCLAATRVWRDGLATGQETDVFDTPRKDAETGSSAPLLGLAIGDNDSVVATWSAAETFVRRPSDAEHVYLSDTVVDAMLPIEGGRLATARRNFDGAWVDLGPTESEPSSDRIHYGPRNGRAHWIAAVGPGRVACGWSDGAVALYADATAGGPRFSLLGAHAGDASSGTASPDGQLLATAGADLSIRLWALGGAETFSGRLLATLEGHTDVVTALAITPDAQRVITTSRDRTVRIWSISEARLLETILDHRDWVTHVAVNPAGTRMATTSSDRTIKLWSLDTYDCLGTAYGHHRFLCLAMSDDVVCAGDAGGDFWILDYDAPAEAAAEARFSRRYVVSGRLAGLFFRTFARDAAVRLGLAGEVRNLRDGRVEVIATGDARQHAELKQALSTGPRSGTVDGIEEEVIPLRDGDGFTVS